MGPIGGFITLCGIVIVISLGLFQCGKNLRP